MADHLREKVDDRISRVNLVVVSHEKALKFAASEGREALTLQDVLNGAVEYLSALDGDAPEEINKMLERKAAQILGWNGIVEMSLEEEQADMALREAQERADTARQERLAVHREIHDLQRQKTLLVPRLAACEIDIAAERKAHLAVIHRLFGDPSVPSVNRDRTLLENAFASIGQLDALKEVLPGLKKELQIDLARIDKRLAELKGT